MQSVLAPFPCPPPLSTDQQADWRGFGSVPLHCPECLWRSHVLSEAYCHRRWVCPMCLSNRAATLSRELSQRNHRVTGEERGPRGCCYCFPITCRNPGSTQWPSACKCLKGTPSATPVADALNGARTQMLVSSPASSTKSVSFSTWISVFSLYKRYFVYIRGDRWEHED